MKCISEIGVFDQLVLETCFRDRGIVWLCMKRVSWIGVLFRDIPLPSFFLMVLLWFLFISQCELGCISLSTTLIFCFYTMSSPASFYVQVGLDNLERPLNCSPSPRAQVRGLIGLLFIDD